MDCTRRPNQSDLVFSTSQVFFSCYLRSRARTKWTFVNCCPIFLSFIGAYLTYGVVQNSTDFLVTSVQKYWGSKENPPPFRMFLETHCL